MEGRHSALGCLGEIKVAEHWNNNSKRCERKKQTNMTCLNSQVKTAAPHFGGTWYSFITIRNSFVMLGLPCLDNTHIYYLNTNTLPHCSFWFWFFPFISHNRDLFCVTIMTCHGNMLFHQACFFPLIFFPLKGQYVEFFCWKHWVISRMWIISTKTEKKKKKKKNNPWHFLSYGKIWKWLVRGRSTYFWDG